MKGLILLCGIALVSLIVVDAQNSLILNCFVSPPNTEYPFLAPSPGLPPVIRAYNESGVPFTVCAQAYVSYQVPTNVTGAYSAYNGWLFAGSEYSDVATCQTAFTSQLSALQQQYGVFGNGVIFYKYSSVSCCQTDQCNNPSKVNNVATRQQPAWAILLSAMMGVVVLRALWA